MDQLMSELGQSFRNKGCLPFYHNRETGSEGALAVRSLDGDKNEGDLQRPEDNLSNDKSSSMVLERNPWFLKRGAKKIEKMHKEHEMEIGYPTDVKHVAHIDDEFKATEDSSLSTAGQSEADFLGLCRSKQHTSNIQEACYPLRFSQTTGLAKSRHPALTRQGRKEGETEEEQSIIPYFVCKIIVFKVKSLICHCI
ncbi:hypothetical protein EJB05_54427, partial [Eragrostis curvula]